MSSRFKHIARLVGLAIYIVATPLAIFGAVLGVTLGFNVVFHIEFSLAHVASAFIGAVVAYALYSHFADDIRTSIRHLRLKTVFRRFVSKNRGPAYAVSMMIIIMLTTVVSLIIISTRPRSTEVVAPSNENVSVARKQVIEQKKEELPLELNPFISPSDKLDENLRPAERSAPVPLPRPRVENGSKLSNIPAQDVCDLGESYTVAELRACLNDIRAHPGRKGVGGPALPLDIRPPAQKKRIR